MTDTITETPDVGMVHHLDDHRPPAPSPTLVKQPADPPEAAVEVDDDQDDEAQAAPVDPPGLAPPGVSTIKRTPIVAGWLRTRDDFLSAARRTGGHLGHATLFHGTRVPYYALRLTGTAPRGAARLVTSTGRWVWDREAAPLRTAAVRAEDAAEYMTLSKLRADRVRLRGLIAVAVLTLGTAAAIVLYVLGDGWLYLATSIGVLALGYAGQAPDSPVIGPAVMKTEVQKLTGSLVLRALEHMGNAKITASIKKGGDMNGMRFTSEICRDGPGYRAELDLPYGVSPDDVMEQRQPLASGLRRKLGCVWPSADSTEHEGRLILWVGDRPMNETKKPAWPLATEGTVDLFRPIVFGNDQRMRWVEVTLMFASVVVGSIPRMGKTFLMRLLLLAAALDPRSLLYVFDFKGTGDFRTLEPVAHRYRCGEEPEDLEYVVLALRELKAELRRRAKVIKTLPASRCPESKVTPDLANDKALGLHPIVLGMDECQVAFEDEKYGAEIESICTDVTKRGPALGIIGMFGTQRPDAKSLPPGISANAVLRFCLKVMTQVANDMVLGQSMFKAGYKATMFSRSEKGIAWMAGEGDDPRIVCSSYVDAEDAAVIVERARLMREEYGNITGHAIGEEPEDRDGLDILGDVLKVVTADEEKLWCERIAARLGELRPDVYGEWTSAQVTSALKPHGVTTGQVWGTTDDGEGANRRGIVRADVVAVVARRDAKRA
jgi:S-DNA-T family DNA segregation ATPase FtsK/SpoIIIE